MPSIDSSNLWSPAGEPTTEFVLCSPTAGTTAASLEAEGDIFSPYREEAGLHNDTSERLLFDDDYDETADEERNLRQPLFVLEQSLRRRRTELNGLNYLNVLTYAAHLFVSWGIGIWGLGGHLETRWEIITKYETLVRPAHWAYFLWAPIVILEGVFAMAQLLPNYRATPLIQDGTKYFFFYTFLIQTAWTICFSFQVFIGSFIAVVAALASLLGLLASQHTSLLSIRRRSLMEYILFRFPFYLHTGWMVLMTVDHLCLLLRRYAPEHVGVQVAVDILALVILLLAATTALTLYSPVWWPEQDFVIPLVVIWSYVSENRVFLLIIIICILHCSVVAVYRAVSHTCGNIFDAFLACLYSSVLPGS